MDYSVTSLGSHHKIARSLTSLAAGLTSLCPQTGVAASRFTTVFMNLAGVMAD